MRQPTFSIRCFITIATGAQCTAGLKESSGSFCNFSDNETFCNPRYIMLHATSSRIGTFGLRNLSIGMQCPGGVVLRSRRFHVRHRDGRSRNSGRHSRVQCVARNLHGGLHCRRIGANTLIFPSPLFNDVNQEN